VPGLAHWLGHSNARKMRRFGVRGRAPAPPMARGWVEPSGSPELISVVEPFVERNGVLRCRALSTEFTLTCTDGLGEHGVGGEVTTRCATRR
jgi:hypothetical protein